MISLPEGPWQSRCHGLFLLFVIEVMFFERKKMFFFFRVEIYGSLKGCQCYLVKVNKQTNKNKQT